MMRAFSLSLSSERRPGNSNLLSSSSNIKHNVTLAILISIFIIQSRSLHFSGDFNLHLPHPISITPSSLSGLKEESVLFHRRSSKEEGQIEKEKKSEMDSKMISPLTVNGILSEFRLVLLLHASSSSWVLLSS
ncbi:hypothetical protein F2Q70_00035256 [Brassica cretica]|uniref:Uncharacterized protein n=1 Tax=Brassica cretica TaxID=69181 RepID=A0A8S9JPS7_BRACR|nr:hypothetical protein F2Q70_00035256 [Brassica cretica]